MANVKPWTSWKAYRFFPWAEWRVVAGELNSMPGVPIDSGTVWVERRWKVSPKRA